MTSPYSTTTDAFRQPGEAPSEILAELEPDESIIWFGRPASILAAGRLLGRMTVKLVLAGLWLIPAFFADDLLNAVARWFAAQIPQAAPYITKFLPHAVVILSALLWLAVAWHLIGALVKAVEIRRFRSVSMYALTDRRCIVRIPLVDLWVSVEVHSFRPDRLRDMHRADMPFGKGSVVFMRERLRRSKSSGGHTRFREEFFPIGFLGIRDARQVERLIRHTLPTLETQPEHAAEPSHQAPSQQTSHA